jgi:hypothetical protein
MKVERADLLSKLLCVEPGLATKETIQQSSCVVFRRGRFYTLSQEIACSILSGLPKEWDGACKVEKVISFLKEVKGDELNVEIKDKVLVLKLDRKTVKVPLESEVLLPVDEVDKYSKEDWKSLPEGFLEAVDLTRQCVKAGGEFAKECIHLTREYMEGCDARCMTRYPLICSFLKDPILVRGASLKEIIQVEMTKGAQTLNWLHFWNPAGLRMSVRKYLVEFYPPLDEYLNMRGKKVDFPKDLGDSTKLASIFTEKDGDLVVTMTTNTIQVQGSSRKHGEFTEEIECKWRGPKVRFAIPGKVLQDLSKKYTSCELTECSLRVQADKYVYVAGLDVLEES